MSLVLHCGGAVVSRDQIDSATPPPATHTWTPVAHGDVIRMVEDSLSGSGLEISDSQFALARDGARMFGTITLAGGTDYATVIGVRNSHDKSFPVSFCLGSRVFVCDNLAFSAEVVVNEGVAQLIDKRGHQAARIEAYKEQEIRGLPHLHDLVMRSYRAKAIPARAIAEVVQEYEAPSHPEFQAPTLWSYFNSVTEVLKKYGDLPQRTQRLHGVVDAEVGSKLLAV